MNLSDLSKEFPEDERDWVCFIEAYFVEAEEYDYIPAIYVERDSEGNVFWVKAEESAVRACDVEAVDEVKFFLLDGPFNKGALTSTPLKPVALFNRHVYFKPI